MRLTAFSDYALRVLIYLALRQEGLTTIGEIASAYGIPENHLMKVVHHLGQQGYVKTIRGKGGGIRLARAPTQIIVGEVLRSTEGSPPFVECFDPHTSNCRIQAACRLHLILRRALDAMFEVLDQHTLSDLLEPGHSLTRILFTVPPRA
jgi:Rrf2 family nitric oxide-sensitive transcriptional repressor